MTDREIMQQALNALEYHTMQTRPICHTDKAIEALRQALAQPEQDWDLLAATQASLREHMARIKELEAQLAQPEQEPVEWDDDEWVKKAMEMSRDFVERAKKNWESPPKGVGTITIGELRKSDLYRKVQTQLLRDILRDDNT